MNWLKCAAHWCAHLRFIWPQFQSGVEGLEVETMGHKCTRTHRWMNGMMVVDSKIVEHTENRLKQRSHKWHTDFHYRHSFFMTFLFLQIVDHDRYVDCALIFYLYPLATFARTERTSEVTSSIFFVVNLFEWNIYSALFADLFNGLCDSMIFYETLVEILTSPGTGAMTTTTNSVLSFVQNSECRRSTEIHAEC